MKSARVFSKQTSLAIPELALIAATRGMLGAGIGLLAADHLRPEPRRAVGWTLLLVGAVSTIPLACMVFSRLVDRRSEKRRENWRRGREMTGEGGAER